MSRAFCVAALISFAKFRLLWAKAIPLFVLLPHSDRQKHWGDWMIRSELVQKIADENPHLYHRDVERIVSTVFEEIIEAMATGNRVELRGFGAFSIKKRDARLGRNPRTGEAVEVEEKHVPFFKTGKLLRDRLNEE